MPRHVFVKHSHKLKFTDQLSKFQNSKSTFLIKKLWKTITKRCSKQLIPKPSTAVGEASAKSAASLASKSEAKALPAEEASGAPTVHYSCKREDVNPHHWSQCCMTAKSCHMGDSTTAAVSLLHLMSDSEVIRSSCACDHNLLLSRYFILKTGSIRSVAPRTFNHFF